MKKQDKSLMTTNLSAVVVGSFVHAFAIQVTYMFWRAITGI